VEHPYQESAETPVPIVVNADSFVLAV